MSHDTYPKSKVPRALILATSGALALVACSAAESTPPPATGLSQPEVATENGFSVTTTYYPDGTRSIDVDGQYNDSPPSLFEFCDGADLLTVGNTYGTSVSASSERTVDYPACADGRLTSEDFQRPPA